MVAKRRLKCEQVGGVEVGHVEVVGVDPVAKRDDPGGGVFVRFRVCGNNYTLRGLDVGVHPEEVGGVVARFQLAEPVVVCAIGRSYLLGCVVQCDVVDVGTALEMGFPVLPCLTQPGYVNLRFSSLRPLADDVDVPLGATSRERRR